MKPAQTCCETAVNRSLEGMREGQEDTGSGRRDDDRYAYIPLYDVRTAAGHGAVVNTEEVIDAMAFNREWIKTELHANAADLYLIHVDGESMEPTLRPGDIILVNHTDHTVKRDGIYVIRIDDSLLVKRLQNLPGGIIRVTSDNNAYTPFELSRVDLGSPDTTLSVIGRVIWAGRRM